MLCNHDVYNLAFEYEQLNLYRWFICLRVYHPLDGPFNRSSLGVLETALLVVPLSSCYGGDNGR